MVASGKKILLLPRSSVPQGVEISTSEIRLRSYAAPGVNGTNVTLTCSPSWPVSGSSYPDASSSAALPCTVAQVASGGCSIYFACVPMCHHHFSLCICREWCLCCVLFMCLEHAGGHCFPLALGMPAFV